MSTSTYWGRHAVDRADIIVLAARHVGTTRSGRPRLGICGMALVRDTQISELHLDLIYAVLAGVDACSRRWNEQVGISERVESD